LEEVFPPKALCGGCNLQSNLLPFLLPLALPLQTLLYDAKREQGDDIYHADLLDLFMEESKQEREKTTSCLGLENDHL